MTSDEAMFAACNLLTVVYSKDGTDFSDEAIKAIANIKTAQADNNKAGVIAMLDGLIDFAKELRDDLVEVNYDTSKFD